MFRRKYVVLKKGDTIVINGITHEGETIICEGRKLHRIVAVRNFGGIVKAGDLGGFIENESNLSHKGFCWVYDQAKVYGYAEIVDNAAIKDEAMVFSTPSGTMIFAVDGGNRANWRPNVAKVCGNSTVSGHAKVYGRALCFDSVVSEKALVEGCARIWHSTIDGSARVGGWSNIANAHIGGNAVVDDRSRVDGRTNPIWSPVGFKYPTTEIIEDARVFDDASVFGAAVVCGKARVFGSATIGNLSEISGDAKIYGNAHICASVNTGDYASGKHYDFGVLPD